MDLVSVVSLRYYKRCSCKYGHQCDCTGRDIRVAWRNVPDQIRGYETLIALSLCNEGLLNWSNRAN